MSTNQIQTGAKVNNDLLAMDRRHVWHPFTNVDAKDPIVVVSGEGAVLKTHDGREVLDCISSWWVNLYGHGHPRVAEAIYEQALKLEQVIFCGFTHEPAIQLSQQIADLLPGDLNRVFFSDNGSTSVEVALKMAAQYWQNQGQQRTRVMVFDGGYHGDTVGAMSVGVSSGFFDAWKKWLIDVDVMPFPETWMSDSEVEQKEAAALREVEQFLDQQGQQVAAMIMEPLVQGASGMRMCRPEFLRAVVALLRSHQIPVIFDEVMTGFGRTGQKFACETAGVTPDLICLSKGLTGGFMPMSITVASDRIYDSFNANTQRMFSHGHSYTANPLGCAAALASLELLQTAETEHNWQRIEHAQRLGLETLADNSRAIRQRVVGTIAAVDVSVDDAGYESHVADRLKSYFWNLHRPEGDFLIRPLGNVIYIMPPYCMTDEQLKRAWQAIFDAFQMLTE